MKRFFATATVSLLVSSLWAAAETPSPPKARMVPPLNFKHFTLPNGLQVYTVEDHATPIVAVQVWYHVGSKDDPAGRSGFAHMFEHMMFKGNKHLTPDAFDNLTENIGGENNAYTADDVTVYHETVPSNYLNPILWAEAERMSALALTDENFASERDVVKEEYRQRIRANPYGEFYLDIEKKSFAVHPYKRPGIGNIAELDASKLSEVRAFHSTFYRPDNATLIVVGDFKQEEAEGWVKKYFGAIAKPSTKIPRVTTKEPPRKSDKRETSYSERAPLPAFAVTYLGPSVRSDDGPALSLVAEILSGGESSRLYQSMVYEQQVVQNVFCDTDLREDLGLIAFRLILASGKTIAEAEKSLNAEIEKVLKEGVTEAELDKAKNRFLTGKLLERETFNGKASALGQAVVVYEDADRVNTDLEKLQAVTAAQIKEAMNRYITGKKKVVLEYLPKPTKPGAASAKPPGPTASPVAKTEKKSPPISGVEPPAASAPHEVTFAQPKETKLPNGLRVVVVERPDLPLLAAELVIRNGAELDPQDLPGTASMTGALLTKGTETMSAPEIASAIESLGGNIDSGAHWDAARATIVAMSDKAEPALRILADVVLHPTFKQEEIDRLKNQTLDGLRVALRQPGALAQFVTSRIVFGSSPYGHSHIGTMESVPAIKREDIVKLYQSCYVPGNAALVFSGNLTLEQGTKYAEKFFGEWKGGPPPQRDPVLYDTSAWKPSNTVVDLPEAGQAAVTVARPSLKRSSPDYYPGLVANAALGTGFVSRLNREIRIKRGLSYGAHSSIEARREVGPFSAMAQTKNESAAEVAGLMQSELKGVHSKPVQGDELKSRQAVLTGGYARNLETNNGYVGKISVMISNDLPLDTLNKFIPAINAVTTEDVSAFAAKYFDSPPSLIIVGKASEFLEPLKKGFPEVRVIPVTDLDLNRAELTKAKP